jgi:hypothetical protein
MSFTSAYQHTCMYFCIDVKDLHSSGAAPNIPATYSKAIKIDVRQGYLRLGERQLLTNVDIRQHCVFSNLVDLGEATSPSAVFCPQYSKFFGGKRCALGKVVQKRLESRYRMACDAAG